MKRNPRLRQDVSRKGKDATRKGIVVVLAIVFMIVFTAVLALGVDVSRMLTTKTEMQNAADAAALSAANELIGSIHAAREDGAIVVNENSTAVQRARDVAFEVAELNGFWIDKQQDVKFGRRVFDASTETWPIQWGSAPYNVVRVSIRKDNPDATAPDAELPLAFGFALGRKTTPLETRAAAFVQARDMVLVLDFSASMNDDSQVRSNLSESEAEAQMQAMWDALVDADPKWPGTNVSKFPSDGFGKVDSGLGTYYYPGTSRYRYSNALNYLDLTDRQNGQAKHVYPQAGRYSSGSPKSKPSNSKSDSEWYYYVKHVIDKSRSRSYPSRYRYRFGYWTLMDYMQNNRFRANQSEDLWRTPHRPFHSVKTGATLFTEFLSTLDYGDRLGLVSYASSAVWEDYLHDGEVTVDLGNSPITGNFSDINEIQRRKQAGNYSGSTAMGDGIIKATDMLLGDENAEPFNGHARIGALPIIIVMTDGNANVSPRSFSLPWSFSWSKWTDYDKNGTANYSTSSRSKKYAFYHATKAIERGARIHTMSVGANSDGNLMRAIAFAGGGVWINVPGGTTALEMEQQMLDAFSDIASNLPPAKLIYDANALYEDVE